MPLFEKVSYHISPSLAEQTRSNITRILDSNGATAVPIDSATHIISDTIEFEGCDVLAKSVACVTPYWVERGMELGQLQDPKHFSADRDMFFSGIVATSAGLPPGDKEVIASGIIEQGGAWREGLTRDVTHLFVTNTRSEKYLTAMHFSDTANITILLPQWFDQCWSTQMRLPPDVFQFPDPAYLRKDHDSAAYKAQMLVNKQAARSVHGDGTDKQAMFLTMNGTDKSSPAVSRVRDIWQGRSILLSSSLELDTQRRESVEDRIRRAGGSIVVAQEEEDLVEQVDVFITRFRTGPAYLKALAEGKTIGTLAWLFYVERTGVIGRPRDQLLHYPVRSKAIVGFADHRITVTNYQGEAREYIKKLIEIMGAKFTPTMSGKNTIVIAAYKYGNKTAKAEEWSVPIVTHKWLEDCFIEWRNLTPAQKKYLDYAPGVNYGTVLGERGVGRVGLEEDPELLPDVEKPSTKGLSSKQGEREDKKVEKNGNGEGFTGTATSMREALEVEEVEEVLDMGGDADEDLGTVRKHALISPTKVGPPRGVKKTPMKKGSAAERPPTKPMSKPIPKATFTVPAVEDDRVDMTPPLTKGTTSNKAQGTRKTNGATEDGPKNDKPAPAKENVPTKVGPPRKPKPRPRPTSSARPAAVPDSDSDSVVEVPPPKKPGPRPSQREEEESVAPGTIQVTKLKLKSKPKHPSSKVVVESDSGSEQEPTDDEHDAPKAPKSKPKPQTKSTVSWSKVRVSAPINAESEDGGNLSGVDETPPRVKSKSSPKTYRSKATLNAKAKTSALEPESDDEAQVLPAKKAAGGPLGIGKGKAKAVPQPSPNRIVSVDLPNPRSLLNSKPRARPRTPEIMSSTSKRTTSPAKTSTKPLPRIAPVRATAYEAPASSPKRGRPSMRRDTPARSPTPSPRRSPRRHPTDVRAVTAKLKSETRKAGSTRSDASSPAPPPIQRTPSRRTAAAAATQKLHDEVMPDVNNYENERRRGTKGGIGHRRKSSVSNIRGDQGDEEEEEESDVEARARKKRKIANDDIHSGKSKGKVATGRRLGSEESDIPPYRFVTQTNNVKRHADEDDEPGPGNHANQAVVRKRARMENSDTGDRSESETKPGRSSWDPKKIRILKTKIEVSEHTEKVLNKLGLRFTQKPHECTHLVTNGLARTEKFLCALPNASFVLDQNWLTACAESQRVVAEKDYILQDPDMEHKHKFKLAEALERARELKRNNQKLLQGRFFYVTPNVPSDFKTLKNVLQALGAECRATTPTIRNLSPTRHVVSCLKDEPLWRPLADHGVTIYSHELVLMAAFTQYVAWDDPEKILPGSH